jgi:hypothetical protein
MNTERAILKGELSDLKARKMQLATACDANIQAVRNFLAGASVRPIGDIDVDAALVNLQEAARQKKELLEVTAKIARIEKELV